MKRGEGDNCFTMFNSPTCSVLLSVLYLICFKLLVSCQDAVNDTFLLGMSGYEWQKQPRRTRVTRFMLWMRVFGSSVMSETCWSFGTSTRWRWLVVFRVQELQHLRSTCWDCKNFIYFLSTICHNVFCYNLIYIVIMYFLKFIFRTLCWFALLVNKAHMPTA